jgi:translocation and assembly module TamB
VADLSVSARDTSLDPFLRTAVPALPGALGVVVTGTLGLQGPLLDVAALDGQVELERLAFVFPGYPVENSERVRLLLHGGRVQVDEVRLRGEGTDLALDGSLGIGRDATVDLRLDGAADLRALAPLVPGLRGRGAATLRLEVQGAPRDPRLRGEVDLTGAGLRVRGFPHGVESLHGTVAFTERSARFEGLTGTVGGGPVEIAGQATYGPQGLHSFEARASGRSLALRYPEGLRSLVDAELRVFGDAERRWVTGTVDVRQATWSRRYDVASELLAARETLPAAAAGGPAAGDDGARLDVRLRAPGTLRVDNNLASLRARADLTVRGTSSAPVLLGRAEVDGGRVYFQGNTYVIRRGTIDFANPQRTDPVFDIEAEARLRSYRITLDVSGTLDRVNPTLSSDPPLSPVQIVSLLAGADEDTVSSLAQGTLASTGGAAGARLAAAGAATLAAGRLSEEVGLERGAERYFGLNRFSIDPTLVRGGVQNPTARLTMGKRVTPDLNVLYSVDLRGNEEHLLSVEYTVSDRFSVLLTRSEPGGLGFDVRVRQSR